MSSDEPRQHDDQDVAHDHDPGPNPGRNGSLEARPKFDDVASLFGAIVPPAGTPVKPRLVSGRPALLPDPSAPAILVTPPPLTAPRAAPIAPTAFAPAAFAPASFPPAAPPDPAAPHQMYQAEPGLPPVERTVSRALPNQNAQPRGRKNDGQTPWPEAFQPTRNFRRKPASSIWTWLLLVPLLAVVAIGVFLLNPQTVRHFVDSYFPHVQSTQIGAVDTLLPAPFRNDAPTQTAPTQTAPTQTAPTQTTPAQTTPAQTVPTAPPQTTPANVAPTAPQPAPSTATPSAAPIASARPSDTPASTSAPPPAPTLPAPTQLAPAPTQLAPDPATASPAATPAPTLPGANFDTPLLAPAPVQTQAFVPPPAPILAAPEAGLAHAIVHYRRVQPAGEAEARRLVAQVDKLAGTVDLRPGASSYRSPTIVYYTPLDRDAAIALGRSLGEGWTVRAGPGRSTTGTVDLWLP